MKWVKIFILSTAVLFLGSCNKKNKAFEHAYKMSLAANDYQNAGQSLTLWLAEDSSIGQWAYDSLAYFHYFYNGAASQQTVRSPKIPLYFVEQGLKRNPKSSFLREIKAKLLLEQGKDTACMIIFEDLYNETKDPTFMWDMCFVEMVRGRIMVCDSLVSQVLKDTIATKNGKVRMEHISAGVKETINAKAAFIYLQALMLRGTGDIMTSAAALQEALRIEKNFYAAKQSIIDLQQMAAQQQAGSSRR